MNTSKQKLLYIWLYLVLSWLLFFITSAGWTMWIFRLFGHGVLFVLIGFIFSFLYFKKKPNLQKIVSTPLIIVQITALLFNFGDCGDGGGSFNFFERLLLINGWGECKTAYLDKVFFEGFAWGASSICFLIYFVVLIVYLVKQTRRK